ncbi:olfactory receptor 14C36-like, partial [Caloenas nicobarica]|uniref:olfactory receptor 14C36-like n=1 Tax=Caloenas nicobarica TaxID=187106 RepID=UPI0032B7C648
LHYGTLLGSRACVHMAAAAWATGFLYALLHTANTFSLPLCKGNALDQFFCEIPQILKLSCSQSYSREAGLLVVSVCLGFGCFVFIVLSYVQILRAVLRIPSEQGRHKAFSTCLPHLTVVSLFVSTGMFAYLKPPSISSPSLDLVVSVLYSVVPPILKLSCSDAFLREVWLSVVSVLVVFGCFVFIVLSYVQILRAVLRIPSEQGRHKAFSTCLPHLAVVSLIISTGSFAYLKPPSISSPSLDLVVSVLYSVVPPAVNPLIYSMRIQELKNALWKLVTGQFLKQ